ncbi:hypothetical protein [Janthinobacterium sp. HLX7-2]|uniref:hypothetical protein n=1 Tax=Janthinobacterium sp. HLX7-2 TaxID=1259331 RepID=UPI003F206550
MPAILPERARRFMFYCSIGNIARLSTEIAAVVAVLRCLQHLQGNCLTLNLPALFRHGLFGVPLAMLELPIYL